MKRPTVNELRAMIHNTVRLQIANSDHGRRLIEADAAAVAGIEDRIANNLALIVDNWIDEATEPTT